MKLSQLPAAEALRKRRQRLVEQMAEIQHPSSSQAMVALHEAINEQRELVPIIKAIVLHQLSWEISDVTIALAAHGVQVDEPAQTDAAHG